MKRVNLNFFLRFSFSYLLLGLFLTGPLSLSAQIYNGNLTLSSQAAIDTFSFTEVRGGQLTINGADIINLDGLSSLIGVDNLRIETPMLDNLDGLSSLTSLGSLTLVRNASLTNIDGLSSLTSMDIVLIVENPLLTNIDGLSNLTSVRRVSIQTNPLLTNIDGLSSLTSMDIVSIVENTGLTNIDGLSSLTSGNSSIYMNISFNPGLTNLDALSSMTSAKGVKIEYNLGLTNIDGLSNLTSLDILRIINSPGLTNIDALSNLTSLGYLFIWQNPNLTNIDGLSNLTSYGAGSGLIGKNPLLTEFCGLYPLFTSGGLSGNISITHNGSNPTQADIIAGGPCLLDPSQIIADLLGSGTINQGQANALQGKVNNCNLNALNNQLSAFVNAGILTQVEANDLSTAANQTCNPPARMALPQTFVLGRSYPNPAQNYTMIPFTLSTDENIKIDLYDASGKKVIQVLNKPFSKGKHEVKVSLQSLPAGTYFYQLKAGEQIEMLPLVVE